MVPIARRSSWDTVSAFARVLAYHMEAEAPARYLAKASKVARKGKIFADWLRNTRGATWVAPWSTRAKPNAPISMPIAWNDLDGVKGGDQYRVTEVPALLAKRKEDPWATMLNSKQRLTRAMIAQLKV